jgi:hypothetical protein
MPTLSAYSNTENTSLIIIKEKGFTVWYDEEMGKFCAVKERWDFIANSITELLGIISIYEYHQPKEYKEYWWKIDEPWLLGDLPRKAPEFVPIWKKF